MQYSFGSGILYGRSLVQSNPTPVRFGALQDVSVDFDFTTKELYGQFQFPLALGRGTGKITCKAGFAQFNAQAFNDLFFGETSGPTTGVTRISVSEANTVASNIVTVVQSANFVADLGVTVTANGAIFSRVSSGPVGQQYSVNESTGVYTFNSSQNNLPVLMNYSYSDTSSGKKVTLANQLLGNSPQFSAAFTETFNSKSLTLTLNACMSSKLSLATKLEDFTIPSFEFMAFADSANAIGSISLEE